MEINGKIFETKVKKTGYGGEKFFLEPIKKEETSQGDGTEDYGNNRLPKEKGPDVERGD